jgi:hypothetical protein
MMFPQREQLYRLRLKRYMHPARVMYMPLRLRVLCLSMALEKFSVVSPF